MEPLEIARRLLAESRRTVAFTGAGVSTASGIPDFRSPGGVWTRHAPVMYDDFLASAEARGRYWTARREMWADFRNARPNPAHTALAQLEARGRLAGVVTQNIDGLHQQAGSRSVIELHGTNRRVLCVACGRDHEPEPVYASPEQAPACACGGPLKAATVSFGQPLDPDVLAAAFALARSADLLIVAGSSLVVQPAAALPLAASKAGADVVIVNREDTPLDGIASVRLRGAVEELLPALADDGGPEPGEHVRTRGAAEDAS